MEGPSQSTHRFGNFCLEANERTLSESGRTIPVPPKVFDTLLLLVQNAGHVLSKEAMLAQIWEDSFVEENNLAQNVSVLRRVLHETRDTKFIETVPKFGYRFVGPIETSISPIVETEVFEETHARIFVKDSGEEPTDITRAFSLELPECTPETHYVLNGDVNIAYQVVGDGPIDIVFVMGWVSHLEYFWKHPLFASFLNRLASFSRLILFDKRGTGLSDRVPLSELPTLEQRMEDVHAVMNAVESDRAVLIGVSEGGPMCSLFAATYPEKTTALVMIGTYAKRLYDDDYPWAPTNEQREAFCELIRQDWGKPVGIEDRAPSMADDEEFREWWATYLRMGASPGAAVALTEMNAGIDVREVLPSVRVPTLVMHRKGDLCLKAEEGRYVASRIPGSKYLEFEGQDHLPFVGNQEEILDEIERFVTGVEYAGGYDGVLATVMSIRLTDLADRSVLTEAEARKLSDQVLQYIRRQLDLFRGHEISTGTKDVLVSFDGPARAIRCARASIAAAERFGVKAKVGLHTGECDVVGEKFSGFAVEMAQRIAQESKSGVIVVSRTVRDLVAGSGLEFSVFGIRSFDGVAGEWPLFAVR